MVVVIVFFVTTDPFRNQIIQRVGIIRDVVSN